MKTLVHLPLRVHPTMKRKIAAMAELEGMSSSEYTRFLLKVGLDGRSQLMHPDHLNELAARAQPDDEVNHETR